MTNEKESEAKSEGELDETSLEKVSGGAKAAGAAGEAVAADATRTRKSHDRDLDDLEVER